MYAVPVFKAPKYLPSVLTVRISVTLNSFSHTQSKLPPLRDITTFPHPLHFLSQAAIRLYPIASITSMPLHRDIRTVQNGRFKVGPLFKDLQRGRVYIGLSYRTDVGVAVKVERISERQGTLLHEILVYDTLHAAPVIVPFCLLPRPVSGVASMFFAGTMGRHRFLILDRVGRNLEQLSKDSPDNKISLKSTLMLGSQAVRALRSIHDAGILHTDICPRNIAMGRYAHDEASVYLLDFSGARRYFGAKQNDVHASIPFALGREPREVTFFSSEARDAGRVLGRRDDLESLAYTLVYLHRGYLPWSRIVYPPGLSRRAADIVAMKEEGSAAVVCRGLPGELARFVTAIRILGTHERPDYDFLQSILDNAFFRLGYEDDCVYDWTPSFETFPLRG